MKRKYLVGVITTGMILTSVVGIAAGSFTDSKFKFQDTSKFRNDEEVKKIYNEVYNSLSEYAKVKVGMYQTVFTSNNVNEYQKTDGFNLGGVNAAGFASDTDRLVMIDAQYINDYDANFQQTTKRVLYHEFGHAIDFKQDVDNMDDIEKRFGKSDNSKFIFSGTEKFKQIYEKEKYYIRDMYMVYMGTWTFKSAEEQEATYKAFKAKDPNYIKERDIRYGNRFTYWESKITEFWAESVSYYMLYPDEMQSVAPETYAYIKNVLDQNYYVPKNLSYGDVAYNLDYFAETDKIEQLKQLIHYNYRTIANDKDLTAIVVNKLGDKGKEYINSNDADELSFDDYVKKETGKAADEIKDLDKTNDKVEEKDDTKKEEPNGDTSTNDSVKDETKINQSVYDKDFANYYGWVKKNGKWYYIDENGKKAVGLYEEGGKQYYFNEDGSMKTGLVETKDGQKVYYDDYGSMKKKGWVQDGKNWYYINTDGTIKTGWVQDKQTWYYLDSKGVMKTGWVQDGAEWYFLSDNGAMKTGWIQSGDKWYYLNSNGTMAHDTTIDGYTVGSDGAWIQ